MINLIKEISKIPSVSGKEKQMVAFLEEKLENLFDTYFCDGLSNIVFHKKGSGENVIFMCHTDAPGVVATYTQNGKTNISPLGKIDASGLVGTKVNFFSGKSALLVCDKKTKDIDSLSDLFAVCRDDKDTLESGEIGYFESEISTFKDNIVIGANLSCIVPLCALIKSAKQILDNAKDKNIYFVFCSQSNLGSRGAVCALSGKNADRIYNIRCIDTRFDSISENKGVSGGIRFALTSKGFVSDPTLVAKATEKCKKLGVEFLAINDDDIVSDIAFASKCGKGAPGVDICIPVYNMYTVKEHASLMLIENAVKILPNLL